LVHWDFAFEAFFIFKSHLASLGVELSKDPTLLEIFLANFDVPIKVDVVVDVGDTVVGLY